MIADQLLFVRADATSTHEAELELRLRNLAFRCGYTFEAFKLELKKSRAARVNLESAQWAR